VCFIRVLHSTEPTAFHGLFLYLEDNFIVKDKSAMWKCISVVAQKAFEMFLGVKAEKVKKARVIQFLCFMALVIVTKSNVYSVENPQIFVQLFYIWAWIEPQN